MLYDGGERTGVARIGDVSRQVIRDWGLHLSQFGLSGLIHRKASGAQRKLNNG
jgi:hypothetical protein